MSLTQDIYRFVIGRGGCVIRDIEGRCSVKIVFPEDTHKTEQIVSIKGDCNDDIADAIVSANYCSIIYMDQNLDS